MRCSIQAVVCTCSLKLTQQSRSAGHQVTDKPTNTYLLHTRAQLHGVQCVFRITTVWTRWIFHNGLHVHTSPQNECVPHLIPACAGSRREWGNEGRAVPQGVCYVLLPLCLRASDTFSVITCRHVSMESRGFSHCFLSGLIWWMLSGTQHVSLETSWKSGGHWRHLKGLSEACLSCPGNVFHWGCLLFSSVFSLVSPVFVQYKLLFCKALFLYCWSVTIIKLIFFIQCP